MTCDNNNNSNNKVRSESDAGSTTSKLYDQHYRAIGCRTEARREFILFINKNKKKNLFSNKSSVRRLHLGFFGYSTILGTARV